MHSEDQRRQARSGGPWRAVAAAGALAALGWLVAPAPASGEPAPAEGSADGEDGEGSRRMPGENEPVGTWAFGTERPVKVVVVGGSVAAYYGGNFGELLEGACEAVEVHNVAAARYGAWAMYKRLQAQVFKNRRVRAEARPEDPKAGQEWWIVVNGGLNSVATPTKTNWWIYKIVESARAHGFRVVALSLNPWGDRSDSRRWTGADGLRYRRFTQHAVDFVMGRLDPETALGEYGRKREPGPWREGELPDIAVDLYDSALRDREAAPYDRAAMERTLRKDRRIRAEVEALPEPERAAAWARLVDEASDVPRWFLREELRAFDHIHPNQAGHRVIAQAACAKLPASWRCDCAALADLDPKKR